jgi:hypothetical protein
MTPEKKLEQLLEDVGWGAKAKLSKYLNVPPVYVTRWVTDDRYSVPRDKIVEIEKYYK